MGHLGESFAGNGFSDLIRGIYLVDLPYGVGKPISGKLNLPEMGSENQNGVGFYEKMFFFRKVCSSKNGATCIFRGYTRNP